MSSAPPNVLLVHPGDPDDWLEVLRGPCQVRWARDRDDALAHLDAWADVVLAAAPERALVDRCHRAELPVIALVGVADPDAIATALADGADDVLVHGASAIEIRRRVAAYHERVALARELRVQQRLAGLSVLSAGLAHEIRNPVNAIANGLRLLSPAVEVDAAARKVLDLLVSSVHRIERLVREVHEYEAGSRAPLESWDAAMSVHAALAMLARRHDCSGVHLIVEEPLPEVLGRPILLDQIVVNLLDNALRAGKAGGPVSVRVAAADAALCLWVADRGPGIAPADHERIFAPFFTTRPGADGMGLGLHLCRRIAEAHAGALTVRSAPGEGAVFELRIPTGPEWTGGPHALG